MLDPIPPTRPDALGLFPEPGRGAGLDSLPSGSAEGGFPPRLPRGPHCLCPGGRWPSSASRQGDRPLRLSPGCPRARCLGSVHSCRTVGAPAAVSPASSLTAPGSRLRAPGAHAPVPPPLLSVPHICVGQVLEPHLPAPPPGGRRSPPGR